MRESVAPESQSSLQEGPLGGRYRLERLLGSGGGGEVFAARDLLKGRQVALKRPHQWGRPADEFATLARLGHPCVVEVFDFDRDEAGRPFFTMELLEGAGSEEALRGLGRGEIYQVARDLLRGLHYLHSQGVVHADLKPANIYVPPRGGAARLMDFGLAVAGAAAGEAPRGTLAYMAPELLHGEPPSASSDLYGFGAVLFEALAGSAPFAGVRRRFWRRRSRGRCRRCRRWRRRCRGRWRR
jgi:serine/threonine protein kinase